MARATAAEVNRRIGVIYDLLVRGLGRRAIAQYAAGQNWQLSPRQLDTYASRAKALLTTEAKRDRALELGKTIAQLDLLFTKALAADDRVEARLILRERSSLLGLAAPEDARGGGGPLDLSLSEQAERFLIEFERQAEALSGAEPAVSA